MWCERLGKISPRYYCLKEKAEEDDVGLDVDLNEIVSRQHKVQSAVESLSVQIENLRLEDKKRGLFSALNKNISKDKIMVCKKVTKSEPRLPNLETKALKEQPFYFGL